MAGQLPHLTAEQIHLLKTTFRNQRGARRQFARQFGVSSTTITKWVSKLGLAAPRPRAARSPKYLLTDERRAYLVGHYTGKHGDGQAIARVLGVPPQTISHWLQQLHLRQPRAQRPWTEAECAYLKHHLPHQSFAQLSEQLNRTLASVKNQAQKMGLRKVDEGYTMEDICLGFQCDTRKIRQWITAGWLRAQRRQSARTEAQGGDFYFFSEAALQRFLRLYPQSLVNLRFDYLWVHDLLVGGKHGVGELGQGDRGHVS